MFQHPGGVGGERDRRAGLTQLGGLLNHLGGYATAPQQQRQCQPADPRPTITTRSSADDIKPSFTSGPEHAAVPGLPASDSGEPPGGGPPQVVGGHAGRAGRGHGLSLVLVPPTPGR